MLRIKNKPAPTSEFARDLRAIDQRRVHSFLDDIARLALEAVERGAERKRKYTIRINQQAKKPVRLRIIQCPA